MRIGTIEASGEFDPDEGELRERARYLGDLPLDEWGCCDFAILFIPTIEIGSDEQRRVAIPYLFNKFFESPEGCPAYVGAYLILLADSLKGDILYEFRGRLSVYILKTIGRVLIDDNGYLLGENLLISVVSEIQKSQCLDKDGRFSCQLVDFFNNQSYGPYWFLVFCLYYDLQLIYIEDESLKNMFLDSQFREQKFGEILDSGVENFEAFVNRL